MPRLSLYRSEKSNDYRFFDKTIAEMLDVGATDLYIHKYKGIQDNGPTASLSTPQQSTPDPTKIQDLLFLENRDRVYDKDIYRLRGHYNVQNLDFDLSQFGLFLNNDVIFITVHYNKMIEIVGRKLMVGDVIELPHLTDYHPLNELIPTSLRRYYQITDGNFASEGFSNTWYAHLWRIKCEPLVDTQEFSNILKQPMSTDNYLGDWSKTGTYVLGYVVSYGNKNYIANQDVPIGTPCTKLDPATGTYITNTPYWSLDTADNLKDILGRYNQNIQINDALISEASRILPQSGYDRHQLYLVPTDPGSGQPQLPKGILTSLQAPLTATVRMIQGKGYSPSPGIIIGAGALKDFLDKPIGNSDLLKAFMNMTLEVEQVEPDRLDTGAGQVSGDFVLAASASSVITAPYGTTDNTYSFASDYPSSLVTSIDTPAGSTVITVLESPKDAHEGIDLTAKVTLLNQQIAEVFDTGTRIISRDLVAKTFTISKPTLFAMPANTIITIAGLSFTGTVTPQMDYRADADPRFKFVVNYTPLGFGYSSGYMSGDGTAPNGLPFESGITFPPSPKLGDYFLRTDYLPQAMYRYDGTLWVQISQNSRAVAGPNSNQTQLGSFINNTATTTLSNGKVIPQSQSLSSLFKLTPD
jgi:hypothetical protein